MAPVAHGAGAVEPDADQAVLNGHTAGVQGEAVAARIYQGSPAAAGQQTLDCHLIGDARQICGQVDGASAQAAVEADRIESSLPVGCIHGPAQAAATGIIQVGDGDIHAAARGSARRSRIVLRFQGWGRNGVVFMRSSGSPLGRDLSSFS